MLLQRRRLRLPLTDLFGLCRLLFQPGFDALALRLRQVAIHIGVEVVIGDGFKVGAHFSLRRAITLSSFIASASWRRARERRDITVPTGISIMSATSW